MYQGSKNTFCVLVSPSLVWCIFVLFPWFGLCLRIFICEDFRLRVDLFVRIWTMGTIRWGTRWTHPPHFFRQWEYNMPCYPIFFSLGFVIYWFHTKLAPSHFTIKLRSWFEPTMLFLIWTDNAVLVAAAFLCVGRNAAPASNAAMFNPRPSRKFWVAQLKFWLLCRPMYNINDNLSSFW